MGARMFRRDSLNGEGDSVYPIFMENVRSDLH